ncbi:MAG TPA: FAD-dependent oxidoreductase [Nitrospiria bacterium]|nr:FAD-dependent oxidoreductase [Nitrospiria bacterium]
MSIEKFDVIVVGAGPSGLAAAYVAAKAGLKVIVFERGEYPGNKNVMGGVFYRNCLDDLIPGFWKEAPLERHIIEQGIWLLSEEGAVKSTHRNDRFAKEPYNCFTVLRAKFDRWFSTKVREAGALIICETVVEELIEEKGKVVGVRTGRAGSEVRADLVILSEGVNSILTRKAGLRGDIPANQLAVGLKEVMFLPKEKIQDRFQVNDGEGVAFEFFGEFTKGMGFGFIYTNKESLSVGVGVLLSHIVESKLNPNDILEAMKSHPSIKPLLEGAVPKEYLAHLVPEGGYKAMPELVKDGLMVTGDAGMMVNGIHREGSNLAVMSGRMAGETAVLAKQKGDFSRNTLSIYKEKLANSFVLKDLKKYKDASDLFDHNKYMFSLYPKIANNAAYEMLNVDGLPKREKQGRIMKMITNERSKWGIAKDIWKTWRALK